MAREREPASISGLALSLSRSVCLAIHRVQRAQQQQQQQAVDVLAKIGITGRLQNSRPDGH